VHVIPEAASERFFTRVQPAEIAAVKQKYGLPEKFILYVGGFDKKKNIGLLIEGYALAKDSLPPLVLAGARKNEEPSRTEGVIFAGGIDDADLPALYQAASAFVYPSLYEGFGLQLVEAMASGLPIVASSSSCFPEILAGAGLVMDAANPRAIADTLIRLFKTSGLSDKLAAQSLRHAADFSWRKTAQETLGIYRNVRL
jgi:glycosyltransferase involved in cell wall biosynthesis